MKKFVVLTMSPFLIVLGFLALGAILFFSWFPSEKDIKGCLTTSMYSVELCPKSKNYVALSQISKTLQQTVILTEDSGFYQHSGFDQEGIEHCLEKMKEKKKIVCGGSTLTQQLAKNMFLSKDKSFFRKGLEALITIKIEKTLSKKEILERYFNVVQFGKNIFGIKQAAQFYFKKTPIQLNVLESAFLAMILPNPEKYSQSYYRKDLTRFARRRINDIVEKLYYYKRINQSEYLLATTNLDFFLKSGQLKDIPSDQAETLSSDDLSEMLDEGNDSAHEKPKHQIEKQIDHEIQNEEAIPDTPASHKASQLDEPAVENEKVNPLQQNDIQDAPATAPEQ